MSSVHGTVTVHAMAATTMVLLYGAPLVIYRLLRAAGTTSRTAHHWAAARGLALDARLERELLQQLQVQRWSCLAATLGIGAVTYVLAASGRASISFLSLPVLLAVLASATFAPEPRRGRVRVASVQARSRGYFAPKRALLAVRVLLVLAVLASAAGAALDGTAERELVHGVVLLAGAAVLELALLSISRRGLPSATADAQLDCAIRVAGSRQVVAAGLVFASFGLFVALPPVLAHSPTVLQLAFTAVTWLLALAAVWAITLLAPLRSWQPTT